MTDDIAPKKCRAFQWIGQSIATCDWCGKPIFDHDGDSRSYGGPFSNTFLLKPFDEAVIANWLINEWIDRQRAAYLLTVTEQVISNQDNTKVSDDIVTRLREYADKFDDDDIPHELGMWIRYGAEEIMRLRQELEELKAWKKKKELPMRGTGAKFPG